MDPGEAGRDEEAVVDSAADSSATPAEPVRPDDVLEAVFSPDGRRLAVTWNQGIGPRVVGLLAGTDSTPPEPARGLPLSARRGAWPTWAPDGLWIAYESRGELRRMRPDGTGDEPLAAAPEPRSHPAWSPDGRRIAFVAAEGGRSPGLWIMAADGSEARALPVPVAGAWRAPAWHPSGSWLAAEVETEDGAAVYRVDPANGSAQRLAAGGSPAFGPRGETLWYERGDSVFRRSLAPVSHAEGVGNGGGDSPAAGGPEGEPLPPGEEPGSAPGGEELVVTPGRAPRPAPDGVRIAFVRGNPPTGALYLLDLETGEMHRVTSEAPERP